MDGKGSKSCQNSMQRSKNLKVKPRKHKLQKADNDINFECIRSKNKIWKRNSYKNIQWENIFLQLEGERWYSSRLVGLTVYEKQKLKKQPQTM